MREGNYSLTDLLRETSKYSQEHHLLVERQICNQVSQYLQENTATSIIGKFKILSRELSEKVGMHHLQIGKDTFGPDPHYMFTIDVGSNGNFAWRVSKGYKVDHTVHFLGVYPTYEIMGINGESLKFAAWEGDLLEHYYLINDGTPYGKLFSRQLPAGEYIPVTGQEFYRFVNLILQVSDTSENIVRAEKTSNRGSILDPPRNIVQRVGRLFNRYESLTEKLIGKEGTYNLGLGEDPFSTPYNFTVNVNQNGNFDWTITTRGKVERRTEFIGIYDHSPITGEKNKCLHIVFRDVGRYTTNLDRGHYLLTSDGKMFFKSESQKTGYKNVTQDLPDMVGNLTHVLRITEEAVGIETALTKEIVKDEVSATIKIQDNEPFYQRFSTAEKICYLSLFSLIAVGGVKLLYKKIKSK